MNLKLKNSLILTGTLILGIIIGVLISGRAMHYKMNNARSFYTERGFNRQLMRVIKPTDKQMKQLRPLFQKQAKKNQTLFKRCKEKRDELFIEFRNELENYITDEQMERFDRMQKKRELMHKNVNSQGRGRGERSHGRQSFKD